MAAEEEVDVVDEEDRVVGRAALRECLDRGILHRAVAVLVKRPRGALLLQRRSRLDAWHGGLWTLSCTGHVRSGETYEDAAVRELKEEVGLTASLTPVLKVRLPTFRSRGLTEREFVSAFTCESSDDAKIDPEEVQSVADIPVRDAIALLDGRTLTPDARILLKAILMEGRTGPGPHLARGPRFL